MTNMNINVKTSIVLWFCLVIASCASTDITQSWKDAELQQSYKHPLIIGISDSQQTRRIYENYFVAELKKKNITATPSYTVINSKQKITRETVVSAMQGTEIDSVLVTYLVSADTELKFHDSPLDSSYSGSHDTNMMSATIITNRGRASTEEIINLKNDFYDAKNATVVWSVQTKTVAAESIDETIMEVTGLLIGELFDDGILQ